jgi:hypothetical protein
MTDMKGKTRAADLLSEPVYFPNGRVAPNRLTKVSTGSREMDAHCPVSEKAPMEEMLGKFGGGLPNEAHLRLYKHWARGGWGMLITGERERRE